MLSEFTHQGVTSRVGQNRVDVRHHLVDPVIVAGPWVAGGAAAYAGARAVLRRRRG